MGFGGSGTEWVLSAVGSVHSLALALHKQQPAVQRCGSIPLLGRTSESEGPGSQQ